MNNKNMSSEDSSEQYNETKTLEGTPVNHEQPSKVVVPESPQSEIGSPNNSDLTPESVQAENQDQSQATAFPPVAPSTSLPNTSTDSTSSSSSSSSSSTAAAASTTTATSFYSGLDLDLEPSTLESQPIHSVLSPTSSFSENTASTTDSTTTLPSTTNKFGSKKIRVATGSNISRRITMLAAGKNENNSDLYTTDHSKPSGEDSPDPADYPDSFFEELLRQDQTTVSRSATTMPKPTPRPPAPTHKSSLPIKLSSGFKNNVASATAKANGEEADQAFVRSDDVEEDLKKLETELIKAKETKAKAEADAKSQRVTVMSLKTEIQMVRNVLKRRETELGDVKDMSNAYESELSELREKLEKSERQLSKGQGEMEAKVRALERMRDESIVRIQTLDQEIKKLREQLQEAEKKNIASQAEILGLREELEELTPFREAASAQRELNAEEPAKVKELSLQITDLEDTRDMQAALIEELETKISTVEAEALEFKGKAELEYEALSDGFKVLKTRRSEEISVLKAELEQHKLQEQIIEKLQADIDHLQSALALVVNSQSTENARINQVTAELNEALTLKDQEVVQVRQNMSEFEESHNRLVSSLQATLATIYEEADAARKSRDEAVSALESLKEELEALRHSLPISKHLSLSQWSAEQQQSQQDQFDAIRELEEKLDGQVEGVKEVQQRAGILEANTKRKSQQLTLDMEHHLQLSNAIVKKGSEGESEVDKPVKSGQSLSVPSEASSKEIETTGAESGTVSVRTMLKFLSQLQGRPYALSVKESHVREATDATMTEENDLDYESQLRVYLTNLNDSTLVEPWANEKRLEGEISQLELRIQSLLGDLAAANQKNTEAQLKHESELQEERNQRDELERLEKEEREKIERVREEEIRKQQIVIESKEQELKMKESTLNEKELSLAAREEELVKEIKAKADSHLVTPPFSAPMTPFGSPGNGDLLPELMAAHGRLPSSEEDHDEESSGKKQQDELERQQKADFAAQQIKLIKSLEEKIADLEKRVQTPISSMDENMLSSSFPSPPINVTPRSSAMLSRIGSQSMRSGLLSGAPDTPPPTSALPPIPISQDDSSRSSSPASDDGQAARKKTSLISSVSSEFLTTKVAAAALTEAAVAAAVAKEQEAQKELADKLEQSLSRNKDLEVELLSITQSKQNAAPAQDVQKLKQENLELSQVLEDIRKSLDQAQNQARALESLKAQLEAQVQKERQAKDEAIRTQDRLQARLEEEMQKKKGFLCF